MQGFRGLFSLPNRCPNVAVQRKGCERRMRYFELFVK